MVGDTDSVGHCDATGGSRVTYATGMAVIDATRQVIDHLRARAATMLDVELDSPSPDEPPRITVRGAVPLDAVRGSMAMLLTLEVESVEAVTQLALALGEGGQGGDEAVATLLTGDPTPPVVRLGRTFSIDGELAERLASVPGLAKVQLTARRGKANLRLVA